MDSPSKDQDSTESIINEMDQHHEESSASTENEDLNKTEESSASEASEDEVSTFDLVKKAMEDDSEDEDTKGNSEKNESDEDEDDPEKEKSKSEDDSDDFELTEDEKKAWKPKAQKRWNQLKTRFHEANEKLNEANQKLQESEADAGYYRQFNEFLESNNLSKKEANDLFNIGALVKNNPIEAIKAITPIYNQLLQITGNVLPKDLQEQVKQGYMTEDRAYELSRSRAQNRHHEQRQTQEQVNNQRRQEAENQQKILGEIQTAIVAKENSWRSDPDYQTKQNRVKDRVKIALFEAKQTGRMPQSKDDVNRMLDNIKSEVDKEFQTLRPRKQPIDPVDSGNSFTSKPEPKNTEDVIRYALDG